MQLFTATAGLSLAEQVAAVQRAWAEEIPRLLVFDNVDDPVVSWSSDVVISLR